MKITDVVHLEKHDERLTFYHTAAQFFLPERAEEICDFGKGVIAQESHQMG